MTSYITEYNSDLIGKLILVSDGDALDGCWFENERYLGHARAEELVRKDDLPVFAKTRRWLDHYFAGEAPNPRELPLGSKITPFQMRVREAMLDIPYGQTITYGDIANRLRQETGKRQAAQAVGGAVGRNQLCVIVPCHRVMGAGGNLTGFGGGLETKVKLLKHEGAWRDSFTWPKESN